MPLSVASEIQRDGERCRFRFCCVWRSFSSVQIWNANPNFISSAISSICICFTRILMRMHGRAKLLPAPLFRKSPFLKTVVIRRENTRFTSWPDKQCAFPKKNIVVFFEASKFNPKSQIRLQNRSDTRLTARKRYDYVCIVRCFAGLELYG